LSASAAGEVRDVSRPGLLPLGTSIAGIHLPLRPDVTARASARLVPEALPTPQSRSRFQVEVGALVSLNGWTDVNRFSSGASASVMGSLLDANATVSLTFDSSPAQVCLGATATSAAPTLSAGGVQWVMECRNTCRIQSTRVEGGVQVPGGSTMPVLLAPTLCTGL